MHNLSMKRKLEEDDCLDVNKEGVPYLPHPGWWVLKRFIDGKDYCDAARELWIWSVGRNKTTGQIIASTGSDLYQHPEYVCLFLR